MIFVAAIDTPANTPQLTPVVTNLNIVSGTITRILVFFPPGVNGLAHIQIMWGLYQLFPSNQNASFAGGDVLIDWNDNVLIDSQPVELTIVTWNLDSTYDHTITVHVVVLPSTSAGNSASVIAQLMAPTPASSS